VDPSEKSNSNNIPTILRLVAIVVSCGIGSVFIYSGYTKLLPLIETFEFTFVDIGIAGWYTAPVIARLLIGLEFFLGVLLVANFRLRRFTLPLTAVLLAVFIVYLIAQIVINGNSGNCGCFGEHLPMTPLQAVIKNIVLLFCCAFVYRFSNGWDNRYGALILTLILMPAIMLPFVINPVDYTYTSNNMSEEVNYKLDLDALYHPEDTTKVEVPRTELRKGKHVIAFLSLTCVHCRVAAKKFRLIKKNNPALPIYFVLNGDREKYAEFAADTKAYDIPYSYCLGKTFINLASASLPRIYYTDNSIVVKKVDYFELSQHDIERWITTGELK
jgi:hypothetical protein